MGQLHTGWQLWRIDRVAPVNRPSDRNHLIAGIWSKAVTTAVQLARPVMPRFGPSHAQTEGLYGWQAAIRCGPHQTVARVRLSSVILFVGHHLPGNQRAR